ASPPPVISSLSDTTLFRSRVATPIGAMLVVQDVDGRLRALDWENYEARMRRLLALHYGDAVELAPGRGAGSIGHTLRAYLRGDLAALDDIPVKTGGTEFQRRVWRELRRIPVGTTTTYGELARRLGNPAAVRAVGLANGANPVGVVVPCHRVIGSQGDLTGYAGGLERKRWLLAHEGVTVPASRRRRAGASARSRRRPAAAS